MSIADQLSKLEELKKRGTLTEAEFNSQKAILLGMKKDNRQRQADLHVKESLTVLLISLILSFLSIVFGFGYVDINGLGGGLTNLLLGISWEFGWYWQEIKYFIFQQEDITVVIAPGYGLFSIAISSIIIVFSVRFDRIMGIKNKTITYIVSSILCVAFTRLIDLGMYYLIVDLSAPPYQNLVENTFSLSGFIWLLFGGAKLAAVRFVAAYLGTLKGR